MEIHTALIGNNISGINQAISDTDRESVQNRAKEIKDDDQEAAVLSSEIDASPSDFCGHDDWKWIDHQYFDGYVMRCQSCRTWLFISQDEQIFFKNLNNQHCQSCDGDLFPFNHSLNQCMDCNGFNNGSKFFDHHEIQSMMSFDIQSSS